jgi:hypothetical protein
MSGWDSEEIPIETGKLPAVASVGSLPLNSGSDEMYSPSHFSEADSERTAAWICQYNFATLISSGPHGLCVTPAPLLFDRNRGAHGMLFGHIARANPHGELLADQKSVAGR